MKNFLQYLTETQKVYEYKIKLANIDPKDHMDRIKTMLAAYVVDTVSAPKHLPIMENNIDFPSMRNADIHVIEVSLKYPVTETQLRMLIAETVSVPLNQVFVVPAGHPEELWRNGEGELKQYVQGDAELIKPYPNASAEQTDAGKAYAEKKVLFKDLPRTKWTQAGSDNTIGGAPNPADGKTTNGIATGTNSPVGSQKNSIPNPNKGL